MFESYDLDWASVMIRGKRDGLPYHWSPWEVGGTRGGKDIDKVRDYRSKRVEKEQKMEGK